MAVHLPPQEQMKGGIQKRLRILMVMVGAAFLGLLFQVWYLQILHGDHYKKLSENNRIRVVSIPPHRGLIYDRNGVVLARNVPSFSVGIVKEDVPDLQRTLAMLAPLAGMSIPDMEDRIRNQNASPYAPWILKEKLSFEEVSRIKGAQWDLPGVVIEVETLREYPYGPWAAHLLGYVGEVSQRDMETRAYAGMEPGTIIGQYGVEKSYDAVLRGRPGRKEIEVDASGRERRTLRVESSEPGKSLVLSLDLRAQQAAEEALGDRSGGIVALDPRSGEVLAMASHPAFDPNILSGRLSREVWQTIVGNPEHPLTNRVIQGQYPPGSVFKVVMAAGALESGWVEPTRTILCNGGFPLGRRVYKDWKKEGHGTVSLHKAVVESCDVYFYQLGRRMGVDRIAVYAAMFGLGQSTGIDLPSEKRGLVPTSAWKMTTHGQPWYAGETISVAIGQGYLLVTPLQQAMVMAAASHDGSRYAPRAAKEIIDGGNRKEVPRRELPAVSMGAGPMAEVRRALQGVVEEPGGTGAAARSTVTHIAGKTGTAQVVGQRFFHAEGGTPYRYRDHAWFAAYAPAEDPRIVVVVLVEHGGHGGSAAAPAAKKVIEAYLAPAIDPVPPPKGPVRPAPVPPREILPGRDVITPEAAPPEGVPPAPVQPETVPPKMMPEAG
jgi:penicillin-binding protein 2